MASGLFAGIGSPSFALVRFFKADLRPEIDVLGGRFDPRWMQRYLANRYVRYSSIAREMLLTSRPYSWDEVMTRRQVGADQIRVRNEARDFGLSNGLFSPVAWEGGDKVAVVLAGSNPGLDDPEIRTSAEILSLYYGSEMRRLMPGRVPPPALLSPRQRDCLAWVRQGKSSNDIADILGIAANTVEEHIAAACRKLQVRTRVQAAVEASLRGLIDNDVQPEELGA